MNDKSTCINISAEKYVKCNHDLEYKIINDMVLFFNKKLMEYVEPFIMSEVKPVIKGEITKGKLKWRGVVIEFKPISDLYINSEHVIEGNLTLRQRDRIILDKVHFGLLKPLYLKKLQKL